MALSKVGIDYNVVFQRGHTKGIPRGHWQQFQDYAAEAFETRKVPAACKCRDCAFLLQRALYHERPAEMASEKPAVAHSVVAQSPARVKVERPSVVAHSPARVKVERPRMDGIQMKVKVEISTPENVCHGSKRKVGLEKFELATYLNAERPNLYRFLDGPGVPLFCFQCCVTFKAVRATTPHWVWQHEQTDRHKANSKVKEEEEDSKPKCLGLDLEADLDEVHLFSRLKASIRIFLHTGRIGLRNTSPDGMFDLSEDNHVVVRCHECFRADTHKQHPAFKCCEECSKFANDRHTMEIMMNWVAKALGFQLAHTRIHGTQQEYEQLVTRVLTSDIVTQKIAGFEYNRYQSNKKQVKKKKK